MPKEIQGLEKRSGAILFNIKGDVVDFSDLKVGDIAKVKTIKESIIHINVETIQEEGVFLGKTKRVINGKNGASFGVERGDNVCTHIDFVFEIEREI
jgi:hypothetical protein